MQLMLLDPQFQYCIMIVQYSMKYILPIKLAQLCVSKV